MNRLLLTDVAIAVVVAVIVLVLSPGLAISGVLGLIVLVLLGVTWLVRGWRRRSRRYQMAVTRRRPPARGTRLGR